MRLISGEKEWEHVSTQKVVTINACCDVACLTVQLPHITTGSFQSHQHATRLQSDEKYCISQVSVVTFSGGVGKWVTVCFLLR